MKLVYCGACGDIFSIHYTRVKECLCGDAWGYYLKDKLNAVIGGSAAIPLGFANPSFVHALQGRNPDGWGTRFEAWVMPLKVPTIEMRPSDKAPKDVRPNKLPSKRNKSTKRSH
jgi:hypothetical protein